ncbi:AAA family ATPase [Dongia sp.]|uniref:AAA family ATPase n=1 Tax=Dongia sp. TaxID=1977262 RepID=UPI00374FFF99
MNPTALPELVSGVLPHADAARPYPRLEPQSFADWSAGDPPQREWLVEGLIPMGTVTLLSGDGGLGKTLLAQQLVMAAALGASWCGKPVRQLGSVSMFCEDKVDEIRRRALPICDALKVARDDPRLGAAQFICRVGQNNTLTYSTWQGERHTGYRTTELCQELRALAVASGARLVLLDSLHDVFTGNENFRPEARAFVQAMANIATAINGAVVVLAHPSLAGLDRGIGTSGSTAWNNAVRSRLYLTRPETAAQGSEIRILTTIKANYTRTGERITLKRRGGVFVAVGQDDVAARQTRGQRTRSHNQPRRLT